MQNYLLSISIWTPIVLGLVLLCSNQSSQRFSRYFALSAGLISFGVTWPIAMRFDLQSQLFQFQEFFHWILPYRINYHLGVDGFSVPLILLTSFMTLLVIFSTQKSDIKNLPHYHAAFLIMSGLMIGVFCALDAILYYIFLGGYVDSDVFNYRDLGWT